MTNVPRVLLVSKPVVPPWNDGSKNLARDLALYASPDDVRMSVMAVGDANAERLGDARVLPAFAGAGSFAPGLREQAHALGGIVRWAHEHDVLHFMFAPTARTATVVRGLRPLLTLRGFRGRTLQTVASRPRSFADAKHVLFADTVVVVSQWTARALAAAGVQSEVIMPSAPAPIVSAERMAQTRATLELGKRPVVLYPGDYETSRGAHAFADAVDAALSEMPDHAFVFACRTKNDAARAVQRDIARRFQSARVRVLGNVDDMHALVACSETVLFPVDDLFGKVDLPLVLLEALALGVPIVVTGAKGDSPLTEIESARVVASPGDTAGLVLAMKELSASGNTTLRIETVGRGRDEHKRRFRPEVAVAAYARLYA